MWIQHMSSLIKGNILSHQCFLSWILLKDKILCCSQLGPGGSPARPRRDLQASTPGRYGPSGEFANCQGVLPKKTSWGSSWGHKIVPFVHQWNTRCFGETKLLTGHHRLLSLTDFNSKGCLFWSEHVSALKLMGFPALHPKADQTSLVTRRKWIFFLQGSIRLPQAIPSLRLGSWWAEAHAGHPGAPAGPLCSTWALPQTTQINVFHPEEQSCSESLHRGSCTQPTSSSFFNCSRPNPCQHHQREIRTKAIPQTVSGENSQISLQPSQFQGWVGLGKGRKGCKHGRRKAEYEICPVSPFYEILLFYH